MAPAALAGVGDLTTRETNPPRVVTLDELMVAAAESGLCDEDLVRLLLGYRAGESAVETLARLFPLNEQLELRGTSWS
jgi:hypothetical protein